MRVTNSMISNSARAHISGAKNVLMKYSEQYTTQKKIQRPSDDPTVAVRALKLRSTYAQLTQYAEKNIKDAMNWMSTTQSSLDNIASKLSSMKSFLDQGANDYLESDERNSVLSTLQQYVKSIFEDEANADYAGRYVFTGYRTDTSLLFPAASDTLSYQIKEDFSYNDVDVVTVVTGGASYTTDASGNSISGQDYVDKAATTNKIYKMHLAYDNCSELAFPSVTNADGDLVNTGSPNATGQPIKIMLNYDGAAAGGVELPVTAIRKSTDADAYMSSADPAQPLGADDVVYLYDTGEILLGDSVYSRIQENKADISIDYNKKEFDKFDIRPEMYFKCTSYSSVSNKTIEYAVPDNQDIRYEVNYSQTITVNTQAKDAISTDIYRMIDYIAQTVSAADVVEKKIEDVKKMISNTTDEEELKNLKSLQETLETEKELRGAVMTEAFGMGLTMVDETLQKINVASAELGAKYNRAQLTQNKLMDTQTDTEEKLSDNEDVDLADVYINLSQADYLYQASLSATAKILGNSLLNYI